MSYSYFRVNDTTVSESSGYANITITRSGYTGYRERVYAYTSNGSATSNGDYSNTRNYIYFNPGEISKTFSVRINNDSYTERTESFGVRLNSATRRNYYGSYYTTNYARISDGYANVTILDNDPQVTPSYFKVSDTETTEGSNLLFTVTRTGDTSHSGYVRYYTSSDTASDRDDINDINSSVYFSAGETTKTITVGTKDDSLIEGKERVRLYLSSTSDSQRLRISDNLGYGTINDNDQYGNTSFSLSGTSVSEGDEGKFTITRSGDLRESGYVNYELTNEAGATSTSRAYFSSGSSSNTVYFRSIENSTYGSNNPIKLKLTGSTFSRSPVSFTDDTAQATVVDDDPKPFEASAFSITSNGEINEGKTGTFTVTRSGELRSTGRVSFSITGGNLISGYNGYSSSPYLTFGKDESSKTITVKSTDDTLHQPGQLIKAQLLSTSYFPNTVSISTGFATSNVIENDAKPLGVSVFSVEDIKIKEGLTGEFTVRRTGELQSAGQLVYGLTDLNGVRSDKTLTFAAGQATGTIAVPTTDNSTHGTNGSFKLQLLRTVQFSNKIDTSGANAQMIVLDDDPIPNKGSASFTISGGNTVGSTKTIRLSTADPNGNGNPIHTWEQNNAGIWSAVGTGAVFALKEAQENKQIRAISTYTDANGFKESVITSGGSVVATPLEIAREGLFDGNTITLEFNRELNASTVGKSRFQVKAGRRKMRVLGVDVNPREGTVDLKLNRDVTYFDDLLITYKDLVGNQSNDVVEDVYGNDLLSLNAFKVTNSYAGPVNGPMEPLEAIGAEYADGQVTLEFNDEITDHALSKRRFKVWADRKRLKVKNAVVDGDAFVTLDVETRKNRVINEDSVMKLKYSDMRGDQTKGVIEDMAGYDLGTIKNMEVEVI